MAKKQKPDNGFPIHPYAELFPLADGQQLWDLRDDIKEHGLLEPVTMWQGKVLDGRRRQVCCAFLGVKPKTVQFKGDDAAALAFVVSKNLKRRHLGETDRALIAAKIATLKVGRPAGSPAENGQQQEEESTEDTNSDNPGGKLIVADATITQGEAAEMMNVSRDAVIRAKKVEEKGTPELRKAVSDGTVSLFDAAKIVKEEPAVQDAAVAAVRDGRAKTLAAAVESREPGEDGPEEVLVDAEGVKVPPHAAEAFGAAKAITGICREIDGLLRRVEEIAKGPGGRLIRLDSVKQQLKDAKGNLWANRASHVCPYCHGEKGKKPCECCKDEGWVAKHIWHQAPGNNEKAKRA